MLTPLICKTVRPCMFSFKYIPTNSLFIKNVSLFCPGSCLPPFSLPLFPLLLRRTPPGRPPPHPAKYKEALRVIKQQLTNPTLHSHWPTWAWMGPLCSPLYSASSVEWNSQSPPLESLKKTLGVRRRSLSLVCGHLNKVCKVWASLFTWLRGHSTDSGHEPLTLLWLMKSVARSREVVLITLEESRKTRTIQWSKICNTFLDISIYLAAASFSVVVLSKLLRLVAVLR